jgi:hypothetical protein
MKSSRLGSAGDVVLVHSWERANGDERLTTYTHGQHPGHEIAIEHETQRWAHRKGAKELATSKSGATPIQCAASLHSHLSDFHQR